MALYHPCANDVEMRLTNGSRCDDKKSSSGFLAINRALSRIWGFRPLLGFPSLQTSPKSLPGMRMHSEVLLIFLYTLATVPL